MCPADQLNALLEELKVPRINFSDLVYNEESYTLIYNEYFDAELNGMSIMVHKSARTEICDRTMKIIKNDISKLIQIQDGPNILKFLGADVQGVCLYLMFERPNQGSLLTLHKSEERHALKWETHYINIAIGICKALNHYHELGLLHKKLGADCIFIGDNFNEIKVGNTNLFDGERILTNYKTVFCNTGYEDPEIRCGNSNYNKKTDVYTFGILLWEMISKINPNMQYKEFLEYNTRNYNFTNIEFILYFPDVESTKELEYVEDLFDDCTNDSNKRPSFNEILEILLREKAKLDA
jgi:serine/threonine protein kinase